MSFFTGMDIATTGLTAQRFRLDIISQNLANANTTRTPEGGAYQRQMVTFQSMEPVGGFQNILNRELDGQLSNPKNLQGVQVDSIVKDESPMPVVYDPSHPDADIYGYVTLPNVNIINEMVDMISASRSYEANVTAFNNLKAMNAKALELGT
ncbi:MAG: flagellar basal body rod protein FlgC [Epulopiscium sp. Nele67-Bin001]|nr:MAG: flagellar basal body rod protein FlgC [Epulopiscium sp. Nuni2H_MBin001]OON91550.1 MAG: flagellar basal body rod protein FlgC [Epulopiscium sp. Nele67-Bin001]